jgi:hypothetical protein
MLSACLDAYGSESGIFENRAAGKNRILFAAYFSVMFFPSHVRLRHITFLLTVSAMTTFFTV